MSEQQIKKLPSHEVFYVTGEGDNAYWHKIGAAWSHSKGNGLNVQLELMPVNTGRLVIRERKAKQEAQ